MVVAGSGGAMEAIRTLPDFIRSRKAFGHPDRDDGRRPVVRPGRHQRRRDHADTRNGCSMNEVAPLRDYSRAAASRTHRRLGLRAPGAGAGRAQQPGADERTACRPVVRLAEATGRGRAQPPPARPPARPVDGAVRRRRGRGFALFYFVGHGQLYEDELCLALRESPRQVRAGPLWACRSPTSGPRCGPATHRRRSSSWTAASLAAPLGPTALWRPRPRW